MKTFLQQVAYKHLNVCTFEIPIVLFRTEIFVHDYECILFILLISTKSMVFITSHASQCWFHPTVIVFKHTRNAFIRHIYEHNELFPLTVQFLDYLDVLKITLPILINTYKFVYIDMKEVKRLFIIQKRKVKRCFMFINICIKALGVCLNTSTAA